jgi:demethylmenaquinone methyltransferase/2-methoxy-6-polyprenyl-1,4-benzoquinol methylase
MIESHNSNSPDLSPKKNFVRRMFDDISGHYDFMNRVISFGLDGYCRKKTVAPHENDKLVLDICCGTGDMGFELMKTSKFQGTIIMADFSPEMFKIAKQKLNIRANTLGKSEICFVYCDAEKMPFKRNIFDGIINGYTLRNLGNLQAFGAEIGRTLKTNGLCSIVDVAHPPNKYYASLFYFYFYKLIPLISRMFTRKKYAYKYLPVSLRTFFKQDEALNLLRNNSLQGEYKNLLNGSAAIYRLWK